MTTAIALVGVLVVFGVVGAFAAGAKTSTSRLWFVADGPVCVVLPDECPAIAMAESGDTLTVQAGGELNPAAKTASGSGTFVHKDADGNVLAEGTFTAMSLVFFKSYGTTVIGGNTLEGGLTLINVHGVSSSGVEFDAILRVDCVLGNPPAGADEGFRLVVQTFDLNFNIEVHGATVFVPVSG
jgi:hypothetical protein